MHRYWECGRKRGHPSRETAAAMAARIRRSSGGGSILTPYRCRFCGQWHLAHRTRPAYFLYSRWDLAKAT